MRIAFVSHNRCGLNLGGLQRQIDKTKQGLERLGHSVTLWNSWDGVSAGEYDVAHFFTADHTLLPVHEGFVERGVPTVLSPVLAAGNLGPAKQRLRHTLAQSKFPIYQDLARVISLVRQAGVVIALHEKEQTLCEFYGRTGPVVRIPNGVAEVFEQGRAQEGWRLAGTPNYYLHVGQFWPNKGQRWLIDNWNDDADLILVGDAPVGQTAYHRACQQAVNGRNVRFLGAMQPDSQQLADLYAGARALLMNSRSEVAPIVINEAFAAGTKVVMPEHLVSDRERKPHATFIHGDVESFRLALRDMSSTPGPRSAMTWDDVAMQILGVYEGAQ